MKEISSVHFSGRLRERIQHFPLGGQLELTYRCNLNCIHCYCKGSEDEKKELNTSEWKNILDEIQKEGCVYLCITGGEPLIRNDFLEIYSYAKKKGFLITIFTNGLALKGKIIRHLIKSPPFSIEVTLNGITASTYEVITQVKGSFAQAIENIKMIKEKKLPLILKSNFLKQNKHEIGKIKAFVDKFLGKQKGKYYFKYDFMIYPRFNKDKTPTNFRLSFDEIQQVRRQDADIWREYQDGLDRGCAALRTRSNLLYKCNTWKKHFFINPYGRLKFCHHSEKFSSDLKIASFREGFYEVFPKLLKEAFKTDSKCKDCRLIPVCYYCPARAYLETGNEESPVDYYCQLAKGIEKQRIEKQIKNRSLNERDC